jgi:hypothetical protein
MPMQTWMPAGYAFAAMLAAAVTACAAHAQNKPSPSPESRNGISLDEYHKSFPPLPRGVRAEIRDGKAVVSWDTPPAPPPGKIGYDPAVARYRVYLLGPDQHRTPIGKTTGLSFTDPARLRPGSTRRYGVTAVQRSGQESGISNEAVLQVPR